jgi:hypothetical protein
VRDELRRAARGIFGPAPGLLGARIPPAWLLEGYAVYLETELTTGGRGRDATVSTLRAQVARAGEWPSLSDASIGPLERYPFGNTRYAFGAGFVPFLIGRVGEGGLRRAVQEYNGLSLDFAAAWERDNGSSLPALWEEWTALERSRAERETAALRETALPAGERIAGPGASRPVVRADGVTVWWQGGALRFAAPAGRKLDYPEEVRLAARPDRLSWAPDGSLVYSRLTAQGARTYGEVYRLGRDGIEVPQASAGRARDATADGECILYLRDDVARSELRRLCGKDDTLAFLAPQGWHISTPAIAPDGRVALTVWRPGGFLDVAVLQGATLSLLTSDPPQDMEPTWTADGRLLFTSDRAGSFQLHEMSGRRLLQLSAAPGGVYAPASGPGGIVVYGSYGGRGVEAHGLRLPEDGREVAYAVDEPRPLANLDGSRYAVTPYAAELTAFWAPAGPTGPGATAWASDPAGLHSLQFSAGLSLATLTGEGFVSYSFQPALDWRLTATAAIDASGFSGALGALHAGSAESQASGVVDFRVGLRAAWLPSGPQLAAGVLLDALGEDAFGYAEDGWHLRIDASTAPAFSVALQLADATSGLPLLLDANLASGEALSASLRITGRATLPIRARTVDGVLGLERVSLLPFLEGEFRSGLYGYAFGGAIALDGILHYYAPVSLGLELRYGSLGGLTVRLVGLAPLLDGLTGRSPEWPIRLPGSLDSPLGTMP